MQTFRITAEAAGGLLNTDIYDVLRGSRIGHFIVDVTIAPPEGPDDEAKARTAQVHAEVRAKNAKTALLDAGARFIDFITEEARKMATFEVEVDVDLAPPASDE